MQCGYIINNRHVIWLQVYADDPDIGNNSKLFYSVKGDFIYTSGLQDKFKDDPFVVDEASGVIVTNVYFSSDMNGHIEFKVKVTDINVLHEDVADVSVSDFDTSVSYIDALNPHDTAHFQAKGMPRAFKTTFMMLKLWNIYARLFHLFILVEYLVWEQNVTLFENWWGGYCIL